MIIHLTKGVFTLQKTSPQGSFEGHSCSAFKALLHLYACVMRAPAHTQKPSRPREVGAQGLLFPPHPLCLRCLAQAQLGGLISYSLDIGGHVWNFTEALNTGTHNNVYGSFSGESRMQGSCPKRGEILRRWASCPSRPFPPLFLTDWQALLHKRRGGQHMAPL